MSTPSIAPGPRNLTHIFEQEMTIRTQPEGDGRTIYGLAVPFNVELNVTDGWTPYTDVFRKGSFAKTIRDRKRAVKLLFSHEHRSQSVGVATDLREEDDGLHAAFYVSATTLGNDLLTLVKDHALDGLSIGFEPITHTVIPGDKRTPPAQRELHERTEVVLREVSLCNFPAFEEAGVEGVRAGNGDRPTLAALALERGQMLAERTSHLDKLDRWGRVRR